MYSAAVREHTLNPRRVGSIENADAVGREGLPGQGNYVVIYLKVEGDRIVDARFQTYGCPAVIAGGSFLTDWVVGKTVEETEVIDADRLTAELGGLPLGKEHCALIAVKALKNGLSKLNKGGEAC